MAKRERSGSVGLAGADRGTFLGAFVPCLQSEYAGCAETSRQSCRSRRCGLLPFTLPALPPIRALDEVRLAAAVLGITEPCALDDERRIGDRFDLSGMWPYYFLFDAEGRMRRRGAGGLGLRLLTSALDEIAATASGAP